MDNRYDIQLQIGANVNFKKKKKKKNLSITMCHGERTELQIPVVQRLQN